MNKHVKPEHRFTRNERKVVAGLTFAAAVGAGLLAPKVLNDGIECGPIREVVVQNGDTLYELSGNDAKRSHQSQELNEDINPNFDAGKLRPGQTVLVCSPPDGSPEIPVELETNEANNG